MSDSNVTASQQIYAPLDNLPPNKVEEEKSLSHNGKFYRFKIVKDANSLSLSNIVVSKSYKDKSNYTQCLLKFFCLTETVESELISKKTRKLSSKEFLKIEGIRQLIFSPADLESLNQALLKAALKRDFEAIASSLNLGGDPHILHEHNYETMLNCKDDAQAEKMIRALENSGIDCLSIQIDGESFLELAVKKDAAVITKAIIKECPLDIQKKYGPKGNTLLQTASSLGKLEMTKALINLGFSVSERNKEGDNALHLAAINGHNQIIEKLLDSKPPSSTLNARNNDGETPLLWAAYNGYKDCVELLIKAGAKTNIEDKDGYTPLLWTERRGHKDCESILRQAKALRFQPKQAKA